MRYRPSKPSGGLWPSCQTGPRITARGLKRLDGKYYIVQITHSLGSKYTMALDLRRVEARITGASRCQWA